MKTIQLRKEYFFEQIGLELLEFHRPKKKMKKNLDLVLREQLIQNGFYI